MLAVAGVAVPISFWIGRQNSDAATSGAAVGGDLHAVTSLDGRTFVSGHSGAGYSDRPGIWTKIDSLADKDAMAWALTSANLLLVGGHSGLYQSADNGETFEASPLFPPGTDVHGLGASGDTVYLATPDRGIYQSTDGGQSFVPRGSQPEIMGTMLVDPQNSAHAIAADMQLGAIQTTDNGTSWQSIGGPVGAMAVAWDPSHPTQIVVIGTEESAITQDSGRTWLPLPVPTSTTTATYTASGALIVAALSGETAETYRMADGGWEPIR